MCLPNIPYVYMNLIHFEASFNKHKGQFRTAAVVEGGGVTQRQIFILHFSLNHGILNRMALFLEKLDFFIFGPPPPLLENSNFFF